MTEANGSLFCPNFVILMAPKGYLWPPNSILKVGKWHGIGERTEKAGWKCFWPFLYYLLYRNSVRKSSKWVIENFFKFSHANPTVTFLCIFLKSFPCTFKQSLAERLQASYITSLWLGLLLWNRVQSTYLIRMLWRLNGFIYVQSLELEQCLVLISTRQVLAIIIA